ncbi:MAG: FAD-binding oxidoreductase [Rhodobacteraceae bacterium]|nr:FAD-binding oxidoreductase [Paracoccaceae bacterium]
MVVAPITAQTPLRFSDPLPEAVDTVIIGGGVIGVFTAHYLAQMGQRVLVCEKGRIAGEQSSRNWGWVRQQGRDRAELPIMMQALELWHDVDAQVKGATGLKTVGVNYLASSDTEMAKLAEWLVTAKENGLVSEKLTRRQVNEQFSGQGNGQWVGAVRTPSDARAEPWQAVPSVAHLAQENGVLIREDCAVRGLDVSAGHVSGVETEAGLVRCEQVVLAGGAWSSLFARANGVNFPQLSVCETVARTAPLAAFFEGCAADEKLALRRRADGGYTLAPGAGIGFYLGPDAFRHFGAFTAVVRKHLLDIKPSPFAPHGFPDAWATPRKWDTASTSPFERMRVLEPKPDLAYVKRMQKQFAIRFPQIGKPQILNSWAGMIDTMPDVVPVVDHSPLPGLIIATGMSGHGFGIGPGFGRIVARMATGRAAEHDLRRFRFSRFSDGSVLDVGSAL